MGKHHFMQSETDALWVNINLCNQKQMYYGEFHFMHSEKDALWVNIILCKQK